MGPGYDNVGARSVAPSDKENERGRVLAKPGSIKPHTKFKAEVYVKKEDEGGSSHSVLQRATVPVLLPAPRT